MTHVHVGHNMPGHLPESDVACFMDVSIALDYLESEISDQQESYWEQCKGCAPQGCECSWCTVAGDCEAAIGSISDGEAAAHYADGGGVGYTFRPDHGSDMHFWASAAPEPRDTCEIAAEQGE